MEWDRLLQEGRPGVSTTMATASRNAFDADYDRAVFSTPVRRLQDKAQVFPLDPNDSVRTRLTHSLEVSTVARSLARQATGAVIDDPSIAPATKPRPDQTRAIEAIAATCGLIHDLGNPPFGHAGERAIAGWFSQEEAKEESILASLADPQHRSDFLKFEGNAQTLRLVSRLQVLADDNGLNLTYGTLSAACKYTAPSHLAAKDAARHDHKKPGFFASEARLVEEIRSRTGTGDARNPITFLVEAADDIVYSACDLEDAVKKGVLQDSELEIHLRTHATEQGEDSVRVITEVIHAAQQLLDKQKKRSKASLKTQHDAFATAFRIIAQSRAIHASIESFRRQYEEIMAGTYEGSIAEEGEAGSITTVCKIIGRNHVYAAGSTPKLEVMGRNVLHDLMTLFWEGARVLQPDMKTTDFPGKIASLISDNYREVAFSAMASSGLPPTYCRLQLVTDFVCGMTDSYAQNLHRELFNG